MNGLSLATKIMSCKSRVSEQELLKTQSGSAQSNRPSWSSSMFPWQISTPEHCRVLGAVPHASSVQMAAQSGSSHPTRVSWSLSLPETHEDSSSSSGATLVSPRHEFADGFLQNPLLSDLLLRETGFLRRCSHHSGNREEARGVQWRRKFRSRMLGS